MQFTEQEEEDIQCYRQKCLIGLPRSSDPSQDVDLETKMLKGSYLPDNIGEDATTSPGGTRLDQLKDKFLLAGEQTVALAGATVCFLTGRNALT